MAHRSEGPQSPRVPSWLTEAPKLTRFDQEAQYVMNERAKKVAKEALRNRTETTVIKEVLSNSYHIHPVNQTAFAEKLQKAVEDFHKPKSVLGKIWNVLTGWAKKKPSVSAQLDGLIAKVQHIMLTDTRFMKTAVPAAKQGAMVPLLSTHGGSSAHNIETIANRMIAGLVALKTDHEQRAPLQGRVQTNPEPDSCASYQFWNRLRS